MEADTPKKSGCAPGRSSVVAARRVAALARAGARAERGAGSSAARSRSAFSAAPSPTWTSPSPGDAESRRAVDSRPRASGRAALAIFPESSRVCRRRRESTWRSVERRPRSNRTSRAATSPPTRSRSTSAGQLDRPLRRHGRSRCRAAAGGLPQRNLARRSPARPARRALLRDPWARARCRARLAGAARRAAPTLEGWPPERIRAELDKISRGRRVAPALRWAASCGSSGPGARRGAPCRPLTRCRADRPSRRAGPSSRYAPDAGGLCASRADARSGLAFRASEPRLARRRRHGRTRRGVGRRLLDLATAPRGLHGPGTRRVGPGCRRRRSAAAEALMLLLRRSLEPGKAARAAPLPAGSGRAGGATRASRKPTSMAWLGVPPGPPSESARRHRGRGLRGAIRSGEAARRWITAGGPALTDLANDGFRAHRTVPEWGRGCRQAIIRHT